MSTTSRERRCDGWQRTFVLHARPYSETSLLLDFFTEHQGRVRVLTKGARSRLFALKGVLQPFTLLLARWGGRGEIKTRRSAEPVSLGLPLTGLMLYNISTSCWRACSPMKPITPRCFTITSSIFNGCRRHRFAGAGAAPL